MRRIWNRVVGADCEHEHTLVVTSVGVRRTVCESCGHISFRMTPNISSVRNPVESPKLPKAAGL